MGLVPHLLATFVNAQLLLKAGGHSDGDNGRIFSLRTQTPRYLRVRE